MDNFDQQVQDKMKELNQFDNANSFVDKTDFNAMMQDKITTKLTAKGEIQAEVRIGGVLTTIKDIDEVIGNHLYAWTKLKAAFPNLVKPKDGDKK